MIIGFIGMSGVGKSHWAAKLGALGFARIHTDEQIEERLRADPRAGSLPPEGSGAWMGFPDQPGYAEREALFLEHEAEVLRATAALVADHARRGQDLVVDMGGSVIYADPGLLEAIRRIARLVYFTIPPEVHRSMLEDYFRNPKPLVWGGAFQPLPGEPRKQTFARCYSQLIGFRADRYAAWADLQLPYAFYRQPHLDAAAFLARLREQ
ncbi:MAG TPA: AAA family ATPase [Roseiflexaceae bacterium]|nr:AAA family ATPase [Roseiflexaceae bacterium]